MPLRHSNEAVEKVVEYIGVAGGHWDKVQIRDTDLGELFV